MSANIWKDEQIAEWIAIITIFLFASWPQEMTQLSETSLGKLFFAFVVAYFTMVDVAYGMLACGLVITYYQLDLAKSYKSLHRDALLNESMMEMQDSIINDRIGQDSTFQDVRGALEAYSDSPMEYYVQGNSDVYSYTHFEPGAAGGNGSVLEREIERGNQRNQLLNYFRKEHCSDKGELTYKGAVVRPEMADHVFREIKFANDSAKCNPCDKSCAFSIIEDRISKEAELVHPKSSKNEPVDWNNLVSHYLLKPVNDIIHDVDHFSANVRSWSWT